MIKGCQKNVIVIRDTKSDIFEQAIFIVKKNIPRLSDYTLRLEAEKILAEKAAPRRRRNRNRKK